jgi:hypothetical protein
MIVCLMERHRATQQSSALEPHPCVSCPLRWALSLVFLADRFFFPVGSQSTTCYFSVLTP